MFPFVSVLRAYDGVALRQDTLAGLTVALFTVPQAMAYALIAGFPPSIGIATAVAASVLGAAFGSSEFLVNGPTNAISVMLAANAAVFATHGDPIQMMILLTVLIGVMQVLGAIARVGSLVRFVSEPVLTGFTAGAGVYIVINQLPALMGLDKARIAHDLWGWTPPHNALFDLVRTVTSLRDTHLAALAIGLTTVGIVRALQAAEPRLNRKLPAPFVAIAAVTLGGWLLGLGEGAQPIKLVRDIEPLTRSLPELVIPTGTLQQAGALLGPALAIGILGAVEAIAIGKVLAAKAGHPFDASRQLLGEGVCNLGAAFVGGFASSGSFTRTAVNYDSGAVTRVSVILSGAFVLGIVFVAAPLANHVPIAALAGTLVHIGFRLVDASRIQTIATTTRGDRTVFAATFGAVLLAEHLEWALFLGVAASIWQALRRAGRYKLVVIEEREDGRLIERPDVKPRDVGEICMLNLQGEMFFAAAEVLERQLRDMLDDNTHFLVVRVSEAHNLDATMAEAIANVARDAESRGGALILCGVSASMYGTLERARALEHIGAENVFRHEDALLSSTRKALRRAHVLADKAFPHADVAT